MLSALSAGLLFVSAPAAPASAAVAAGIDLHFGGAPRVYFARPPRTILIPDTQVYYVEGADDDVFQCDGWWYVDDGGYWFRAPSYRGPFVSVSFESVPGVILNVPSAYAHQPYLPGVWRGDARSYGYGYDNRRWRDADERWHERRGWQRDDQGDRGDDQDNGNRGQNDHHGRGRGNGHRRDHDRDRDGD
jgi:hypothetical protein